MTCAVIIATYNGEKYICEQLKSVIGQSVKADYILITDDGSTDNTLTICEDSLKECGIRYRIVENAQQLGPGKNFMNRAVDVDQDVVFFCDQDDVWNSTKIEKSCYYLKNKEVVAVFCNAEIVDNKLNNMGKFLWDRINFHPTSHDRGIHIYDRFDLIPELLKHNVVTGMCLAIKREFVKMENLPDGTLHDAWLAWNSTISGKVVAIEEPLVKYRQHSNNAVGSESKISAQRFRDYSNIRVNQFNTLYKRYAFFKRYMQVKGISTEYDDALNKCIDFQKKRIGITKMKKYKAFIECCGLFVRGDYKKYTENNVLSFMKDIFVGIK